MTCLEVWGSLHGCMLDIMEVAPPKSTLITFPFFFVLFDLGPRFWARMKEGELAWLNSFFGSKL